MKIVEEYNYSINFTEVAKKARKAAKKVANCDQAYHFFDQGHGLIRVTVEYIEDSKL